MGALFCAILVSSGFAQTAKVLINHVGYDPAVAKYARKTMDGDKAGRRDLYKALKIKEDDSVKK